ncbi:hypothetical protein L204_101192 [Cryptococcus depauperatus]|nr:hypothetical protein L204_00877 [Cryptococcus depauperatus CBS 7855]
MPYALRLHTRDPLQPLPLLSYTYSTPLSPHSSSSKDIPSSHGTGLVTLKRSSSAASLNPTPRKVSRGNDAEDKHVVGKSRAASNLDNQEKPKLHGSSSIPSKIKSVLERDDLGTGKSPARKLFMKETEQPISGISGAVITPQSKRPIQVSLCSSELNPFASSSSSYNTHLEDCELHAPNTAMSINQQCADEVVDHSPGFVIYPDKAASSQNRRNNEGRTSSHQQMPDEDESTSLPSSPSVIAMDLENQENIPPPSYTYAASQRSTPSKSSTTSLVDSYLSASTSTCSGSGSGLTPGSRRREGSKLVNEILLLRGEVGAEKGKRHEEHELTPGRRTTRSVAKNKARLAQEVNLA